MRLIQLRRGTTDDLPFQEQMLFEAFSWEPSVPRPAFDEFHIDAEFRKLLSGWGRRGDCAVIVEDAGVPRF